MDLSKENNDNYQYHHHCYHHYHHDNDQDHRHHTTITNIEKHLKIHIIVELGQSISDIKP